MPPRPATSGGLSPTISLLGRRRGTPRRPYTIAMPAERRTSAGPSSGRTRRCVPCFIGRFSTRSVVPPLQATGGPLVRRSTDLTAHSPSSSRRHLRLCLADEVGRLASARTCEAPQGASRGGTRVAPGRSASFRPARHRKVRPGKGLASSWSRYRIPMVAIEALGSTSLRLEGRPSSCLPGPYILQFSECLISIETLAQPHPDHGGFRPHPNRKT